MCHSGDDAVEPSFGNENFGKRVRIIFIWFSREKKLDIWGLNLPACCACSLSAVVGKQATLESSLDVQKYRTSGWTAHVRWLTSGCFIVLRANQNREWRVSSNLFIKKRKLEIRVTQGTHFFTHFLYNLSLNFVHIFCATCPSILLRHQSVSNTKHWFKIHFIVVSVSLLNSVFKLFLSNSRPFVLVPIERKSSVEFLSSWY